MNRSMIIASNTMNQLQKQLDIISNNMANADTNGFKKREATFTDLLAQSFNNQPNKNDEIGRLTPEKLRLGTGAKMAQAQLVLTQGNIKDTGRPLDVALTNEKQFFKVMTNKNGKNEVCYTRDGNFSLSPMGTNEVVLVNSSGYPVLDEKNQMIIFNKNAKDYAISENGKITVTLANGKQQTANLGMISVRKPQFLEQIGENLLGIPAKANININDVLTEMTGPLRNQISMKRGSLETSNVDTGKEMTDLINVQRSYQFQSKAITMSDQMMGLINGIR
ncbi:flagellar hook-basal body protein [Heyndrickxia sporothermodurans]|nr:flagellar hook-basal body protein [Heyndrickxia sporothermodurans]MEB6550556.1 flagellar hook-basal body protein [Heyndrickxia sporothermodurans]MED3649086.1 flagellar hook-basal body protein [Heyndrickxia sporothermodurans]MED3655849.1 flagellar hook-basal body protein [Heyndrickxia sporothermodurans]MED3698226.1 flagellar hook-basal body protein [Heyndrickxia sporothermodurans]PTY78180.1 flagellar biosynthesis protein FlgG [Heyndrickxia sporothermodurans]